MFANRDRITVTVTNVYDRNGNILPFTLPLPIDREYTLPDNVARVGIFEYHEGTNPYGKISINIYVGVLSTVEDIVKDNEKNIKLNIAPSASIESPTEQVCYYIDDTGNINVFAKVSKDDIVVSNTEELKSVIEEISDNCEKIIDGIDRIKNLKSIPSFGINYNNGIIFPTGDGITRKKTK